MVTSFSIDWTAETQVKHTVCNRALSGQVSWNLTFFFLFG